MDTIQLIAIIGMVATGMTIPSVDNVVPHVIIFVISLIVYLVTKIHLDKKNEDL
jgi:uncharacterized membrane protein (DUF106 family)